MILYTPPPAPPGVIIDKCGRANGKRFCYAHINKIVIGGRVYKCWYVVDRQRRVLEQDCESR